MRYIYGATISFLCSCTLTPEYCRSLGVDVPDGSLITGRVVAEHISDSKTIHLECGAKACAKQVAIDEWVIWSIDDDILRQHEYCHASYQTVKHLLIN